MERSASDIARPQHPPVDPKDDFHFTHPRIDDFVARYQTDLREFFTTALARSARYMPRMVSILRKEGVPTELAYLPLIESGYRTQAVSRAGAAGPWQFIPGTGRRYGLRIDRYVDERCDPVKATQAAARYLHDLHDMFGDWHLSLAAYNTGEGRISRILNSGVADDYWQMRDEGHLYRETENYVPGFLAAVQIAQDPVGHGFEAPEEPEPVRYDLVSVSRSMPLSAVADLAGAPVAEIKELNPALNRGVIPPNGYTVRIPKGSRDRFEAGIDNYERKLAELEQARAERARYEANLRSQRAAEAARAKSQRSKGTARASSGRKSVDAKAQPASASVKSRGNAGRGAASLRVVASAPRTAKPASRPGSATASAKAATKPAKVKPAPQAAARPAAQAKPSATRATQSPVAAAKAPARRGAPLVTANRGPIAKAPARSAKN